MRESIKSIQFLRFIAASLVVISHSMLAIDLYFRDSISRSSLYFANFGGVGVHIFFVISGFIMVYTSFGGGVQTFYPSKFLLRRFIRIYPIYWIYAIFYLLAHQVVADQYHLSYQEIIRALLLLPGDSSLIIGPSWTLAYEVYFYICFGIFMFLGPLRGLASMTLFFLASIAIGASFHADGPGFHVVTDVLLMEFLAGAWIAYFFVAGVDVGARLANALIVLDLAGFSAGFAYGYHRLPSIFMWGVPSAFLIAGFVFKERGDRLSSLVQRTSFLGDSSYSLYLLHILLIDVFFSAYLTLFANPGFGYVAICLALTVVCVAIALVFYELLERRIVGVLQSMVRNISGSRVTRPVV